MSILVVGSVAYDGIKSPSGQVDRVLGGAATYFSLAASFFTTVRIVAVVGDDFSAEDEAILTGRGVDTSGIERVKGKSFFWRGEYSDNLNEAKTLATELNVFADFNPQVPKHFSDTPFLFLANIHPTLQGNVRRQMPDVRLVGGDTMNYWINGTPVELTETLKGVDVLLINDTEARMLGKNNSLPRAAQNVMAMGPNMLVIKHGEFGATVFFKENGKHPFRAPAFPVAHAGTCWQRYWSRSSTSRPAPQHLSAQKWTCRWHP